MAEFNYPGIASELARQDALAFQTPVSSLPIFRRTCVVLFGIEQTPTLHYGSWEEFRYVERLLLE